MPQIAKRLNCNNEKAYRWYHRTEGLIEAFENEVGPTDPGIERLIRKFIKDKQRPGAPLFYTPEQQLAIVAMATEKPKKYGIESDIWSHRELALAANKTGITANVSKSTVGRILAEADIKPHRIKYWEFPNIEDRKQFDNKVVEICDLYRNAEKNLINNLEFEYKRHGTQALIPSFEVGSGKIINCRIGAARTAEYFAALIENTINLDPKAEWVFIADQLNIHKSEELVRLFAEKMNIKDELGEKGEHGILKNLQTRERFLSDKTHEIRFVYTPKHCSWLNQIEIW